MDRIPNPQPSRDALSSFVDALGPNQAYIRRLGEGASRNAAMRFRALAARLVVSANQPRMFADLDRSGLRDSLRSCFIPGQGEVSWQEGAVRSNLPPIGFPAEGQYFFGWGVNQTMGLLERLLDDPAVGPQLIFASDMTFRRLHERGIVSILSQ